MTARTLTALLRREAAMRGVSVARMLQEARGRLAAAVAAHDKEGA
jgi:hypothetical protein